MEKIHITLEKDQMIWFTSDLHFGHRNILNFCNRPFEDTKFMDMSLIDNWNKTVGDNDIIFILGDVFWFNNSRDIKKYITSLKGKEIYIIPGNHDDFSQYHRLDDPRVKLCNDVVVLWVTDDYNRFGRKITELWLCHYPMMTWPHIDGPTIQLFGHIHSQPFVNNNRHIDLNLPLHYNQMDVGCDYWNYKPISLKFIYETIKNKKEPV